MPDAHLLSVSFAPRNEETTYLEGTLAGRRITVTNSTTYEMSPGSEPGQLTHGIFVDHVLKSKLEEARRWSDEVFLSVEVTRSSSVARDLINLEGLDPATVFITDDLAVRKIDREDYEVPESCYGVPKQDMDMIIELAHQANLLTIKGNDDTLAELKEKVESGDLDYSDPAAAALGAMCWYARHLNKKDEV